MSQASIRNFAPSYNGPEGQEDMPWLLTAGPVITSREVKLAMLADWSVHDSEFISLTLRVSEQLSELANSAEDFDCIPLDVSGVAALECALSALAPAGRKRKTLIAAHGLHAKQAENILTHIKRPFVKIAGSAYQPVTAKRLSNLLASDPDIKTVYLVVTDVLTGLLNPVDELAEVAHAAGCKIIIDVRASLGAITLDLATTWADAIVGVPWVCIESVPGFSFIMIRRELLDGGLVQCPSASLDLFELWNTIQRTGRFPGTPPAHAVAACGAALRQLYLEGGPEMRLRRYGGVHQHLLKGMAKLGFRPFLGDDVPTCGYLSLFQPAADAHYSPQQFQQRLRQKGFVIMSGEDCPGPAGGFRIGTIGGIDEGVVDQFLVNLEKVMRDLGMRSGAPAK